MTVASLTMEEYNTLFGSTVENGGVLVKSTDVSPEVAILFEKNKLGTKDKVYYALFDCKFSPPSISAQSFEGGIDEEVVELNFSVRELASGDEYYKLDSGEHVGTKATNFYT